MSSKFQAFIVIFTGLFVTGFAQAESWRSGPQRVTLIELYSSEGCSSCPPAEAWLNGLRREAGLWVSFVPVAFPVDYWNYLGWEDPLSRDAFTERQRQYGAELGSGIYTPEFIRDGVELGSRAGSPLARGERVGTLEVREDSAGYAVAFRPLESGGAYQVFGALLGNEIESSVTHGENRGRTLRHDFVALSLAQASLTKQGDVYSGKLMLAPAKRTAAKKSIAIWVTRAGSLKPVQAFGRDL